MRLPGTVRICCLVVMAPALAKAVIDIVDLPYTAFHIGIHLTLTPPIYVKVYNIWIPITCSKPFIVNNAGWCKPKEQHCPARVGRHSFISLEPTMNREILPIQDSMGLLSTNTSLDGNFKISPEIECPPSAFSTVEQELLVMSPRELEDPSELPIFEMVSDNMEHPLTPPASRPGSVPVVGVPSSRQLGDVEKSEQHNALLQKRTAILLQRLRKLQIERMELHVTEQLRNFVSHQQKTLGVPCQKRIFFPNRRMKDSLSLKTELLQSEDVKNLSTAALVKLVRKLESHGSTRLLQLQKGILMEAENRGNIDKTGLKLDPAVCAEIGRATGTVITNLRHLESAVDSDATENSSGGESCTEYEDSLKKKSTPSIRRRAEWKWAISRAEVARRWTWLQAQVSDLEYRIRQQNELYCQLRASKSCVTLGDHISDNTFNQTNSTALNFNLHSIKRKSDGSSHSSETSKRMGSSSVLSGKHLKPVNGYFDTKTNGYHAVCGVLSANSNSSHCGMDHLNQKNVKMSLTYSHDATPLSSRTRPIKSFKRRKLYRTIGLHLFNKKAANLSSVKCNCNCQCQMSPCALCGGRYNFVQTLDQDVMSVVDRVALMDPSFHPILSFGHDVSLSLNMEMLMKNMEISKSNHLGLRIKKKSQYTIQTKGLRNQVRKQSCKLARNAAQTLLSSAKFRKNFCSRKHRTTKKFARERRRKMAKKKQNFGLSLIPRKKRKYRRRTVSVVSSDSSRPGSPVSCSSYTNIDYFAGQIPSSSGRSSSILQDMLRRRRGESAFDINNIVIPYSIASSTRVEKLQYKEILTPKWRLLENVAPLEGMEDNNSKTDEIEDISDEAFTARHELCEVAEKKKFVRLCVQAQVHGRTRSRSRSERADSSGANTPDPLSPHQLDMSGQDSNSGFPGIAYSPIHPSSGSNTPMFFEDSQSNMGMPGARTERKRTTSLSKKDRPEETQFDMDEVNEVVPYDPYVFPLSNDIYDQMLKTSCVLKEEATLPVNVLLQPASPPDSPLSSTSSSIPEEDPSDPEWTVISERGSHQSLVLRLAKR